jgi:hypothetical protein
MATKTWSGGWRRDGPEGHAHGDARPAMSFGSLVAKHPAAAGGDEVINDCVNDGSRAAPRGVPGVDVNACPARM